MALVSIGIYDFFYIYIFLVSFYQQLVIHSWLLLPGILDISNFATSRAIYPAPLSFSTWSKQKAIGKTIIFSCYLEIFSFKNCSQISLFKHPLTQLLQLCRQEWDSQIEFFLFFFLIECFDLNFFIARIFNFTVNI